MTTLAWMFCLFIEPVGSLRVSGRRVTVIALCCLCAGLSRPALADHDPALTATIYVHGFDLSGASHHGTYGDEFHESVADSIAALAGLPTSGGRDGPLPPNVVIGVGYYGDQPPSWYSATDRAAVDSVTAAWGGGVPRYATIIAKFARHVLARSGARQVNFVSASFGSLIVRWMIEKNVEGLAGEGRVARWLSVEGLLGGNWAASHSTSFLDFLSLELIDVRHMSHDWIDANLHLPHSEADQPLYRRILIGEVASTDERYNDRALSALMASARDWQPNDGLQALPDAVFQTVTPASRFEGLPPTCAVFHATHFGLKSTRGAWAEGAVFLTQRRRVTVTMTSATVTNLHEPELPYWDWRPGEIVFESRVYSGAAERRWGITDPLCAYLEAGGAAPLLRFARDGETQVFQHVVYDDFVLPEETSLAVDLRAYDVDYDPHYGVYETATTPYLDDLGGGMLHVSTLAPGSYAFAARDWSAALTVQVTDYPFSAIVDVPQPAHEPPVSLSIAPNPSRDVQWIAVPEAGGHAARLDILDLSGRVVRRAGIVPQAKYLWDGRDDGGRWVHAGIYLIRVSTPERTWVGRSLIIR